jgi:hypothetical protein
MSVDAQEKKSKKAIPDHVELVRNIEPEENKTQFTPGS